MKWFNLKKNTCPKCDKDFMKGLVVLTLTDEGGQKMYWHKPCDFKIREARYQQIVANQVTRKLEDKWNRELEEVAV